jgi:hypothetical protein
LCWKRGKDGGFRPRLQTLYWFYMQGIQLILMQRAPSCTFRNSCRRRNLTMPIDRLSCPTSNAISYNASSAAHTWIRHESARFCQIPLQAVSCPDVSAARGYPSANPAVGNLGSLIVVTVLVSRYYCSCLIAAPLFPRSLRSEPSAKRRRRKCVVTPKRRGI